MKQLNKLRATLIYNEYGDGNCSTECSEVMKRFLKDCPSIIERRQCKTKGKIYHDISTYFILKNYKK